MSDLGLRIVETCKAGPCSACGDGDTAMEYHNHEPPPPRYTRADLRNVIKEFLSDMESHGHATVFGADSLTDWKFETFLQWLARREREGRG